MKHIDPKSLVNVLGIHIAPIDMDAAVALLADALERRTKGFVCLTGVHGVMEAQRDASLRAIFADSLLTAPDGMPTVWVGHWQGHTAMRQITGPDLMLEVLSRPEFAGCTHFLYGGKEGVADELQRQLAHRYPAVKIVGTWTPPFRELTLAEEAMLIARVERLQPDVVWVGISTPRQERFMQRMLPRLNTRLMFGVGAAFDFHTGRIQDCPNWVKRAGMQWFDRLLQDPKHLWKRYLRNNPAFVWNILLQLSGLRSYPHLRPGASTASAPHRLTKLLRKAGSGHGTGL